MKPRRYCEPGPSTVPLVAHIPLASAMLCADEKCNAIFPDQACCPACGSRQMLGLSAVFGRRSESSPTRLNASSPASCTGRNIQSLLKP